MKRLLLLVVSFFSLVNSVNAAPKCENVARLAHDVRAFLGNDAKWYWVRQSPDYKELENILHRGDRDFFRCNTDEAIELLVVAQNFEQMRGHIIADLFKNDGSQKYLAEQYDSCRKNYLGQLKNFKRLASELSEILNQVITYQNIPAHLQQEAMWFKSRVDAAFDALAIEDSWWSKGFRAADIVSLISQNAQLVLAINRLREEIEKAQGVNSQMNDTIMSIYDNHVAFKAEYDKSNLATSMTPEEHSYVNKKFKALHIDVRSVFPELAGEIDRVLRERQELREKEERKQGLIAAGVFTGLIVIIASVVLWQHFNSK